MTDNVRQDELIVDLRQRDAVATVLTHDLGVWPAAEEEESADLDLALLKNLRLSDYAPRARKRYANEIAALEQPGRSFTDLDVLLYDLRLRFGAARGWEPLVGKNRDAVVGFPQHKDATPPRHPIGQFALTGNGGAGVRIGVVDGPFAPHELLPAEVVMRDEEFVGTSPAPVGAGHATFVCGLIRRAAPGARLDVRTGLDAESGLSTAWTAARKIASFRNSDVDILNLSLGCVTIDGEPPLVLRRALERLDSRVLVVAAAGNRADLEVAGQEVKQVWPGAASRVIAVGAIEPDGGKAAFSMDESWVDCVAPGVDVTSTYVTGPVEGFEEKFDGFATWNGTSFAAATVSGAIAATMSAHDLPAEEAFKRVRDEHVAGVLPHAKD